MRPSMSVIGMQVFRVRIWDLFIKLHDKNNPAPPVPTPVVYTVAV